MALSEASFIFYVIKHKKEKITFNENNQLIAQQTQDVEPMLD